MKRVGERLLKKWTLFVKSMDSLLGSRLLPKTTLAYAALIASFNKLQIEEASTTLVKAILEKEKKDTPPPAQDPSKITITSGGSGPKPDTPGGGGCACSS